MTSSKHTTIAAFLVSQGIDQRDADYAATRLLEMQDEITDEERLARAAPDLLAALVKAHNALNDCTDYYARDVARIEARAALVKATGGQP